CIFDAIYDELHLPARLVERNAPMREDLHAIGKARIPLCFAAIDHAAQGGEFILEGEIGMARRRQGKIRDLAMHPEILQVIVCLKKLAQILSDLTHAVGANGWQWHDHRGYSFPAIIAHLRYRSPIGTTF